MTWKDGVFSWWNGQQAFHRCLLQTAAAAPARAYLEKRSLGPDVVELFELGYDPEPWGSFNKKKTWAGTSLVVQW